MNSILEALVNTLSERLFAGGFELPKTPTEKERLGFIFQSLDQAAILPVENFNRIISAAQEVVNRWESGDLADAVRTLALALPKDRNCSA